MIRFPPAFLEQLRSRTPISTVVGRYVKLQRKTRGEYQGLCPFHAEKTPSFTVSDPKGFYHCFGCGAHGDVMRFLTEHTGARFEDVVKDLAQQAGVPLPKADAQEEARYRKQQSLSDIMEVAARWYEAQLKAGAGRQAAEYLRKRGVSDAMAAGFRLGYSPEGRDSFKQAMLARDITEAQLLETGMLIKPEDGGVSYDRFRNRLMFPILDSRGRVIAFGGRALGDSQPKYLNSPETALFHKGSVLYGWQKARDAAFRQKQLIVVEGYMDVIALHQAGFDYATAPLGTAVTREHLQSLWQAVDVPTFCLDGDNAGIRAMGRAALTALPLLSPGKSLQFVQLPAGQDPDDLLKSKGKGAFTELLAHPLLLVDVLFQLAHQGAITGPEAMSAVEEQLMEWAKQVPNPTLQRHLQQAFKDKLYTARKANFVRNHGKKETSVASSRLAANLIPAGAAYEDPTEIRMKSTLLIAMYFHAYLMEHAEIEEYLFTIDWKDPNQAVVFEAMVSWYNQHSEMKKDMLRNGTIGDYLEKQGLKNHIETMLQTQYDHTFTKPDAAPALVRAGWVYVAKSLTHHRMEREYATTLEAAGDAAFERVWELKQQKDELKRDVLKHKQAYEALLDEDVLL